MTAFPSSFNQQLEMGSGGSARLGLDVLQALVDGIRQYREQQQCSRWTWGTCAIACAMAADDQAFLDELEQCESSCLLVSKQQPYRYTRDAFRRLEAHAARAQGLAQAAFPELSDLAPLTNGKPLLVGPSSPMPEVNVSPVREFGFRKVDDKLVPILHAKLVLLGDMCWTDEHPSGAVVDDIFFVPRRLWVGSANFTGSSRRSLEFGAWLTDASLLGAARTFILRLVAHSEPLREGPDEMRPEFAPVEHDDIAFLEYLSEAGPWIEAPDE